MLTLSIELECLRLVNRYCLAADHNDLAAFLSVFTEDAVWTQPTGNSCVGHEALRLFFENRPKGVTARHVSSNAIVDVLNGDHARGISYATVYRFAGERTPPGPADALQSLIEYHDEYVRTQNGWKIRGRRGVTVFRRA